MSYLLDTDVLSDSSKPRPSPRVQDWLVAARSSVSYLSVISVGEIRAGIEAARTRDPVRASRLDEWLATILSDLADRVLAVDAAVADRWGRVRAALRHEPIETTDGLIAATALTHDLTLVTRNVRLFERTGVRLLNPFG